MTASVATGISPQLRKALAGFGLASLVLSIVCGWIVLRDQTNLRGEFILGVVVFLTAVSGVLALLDRAHRETIVTRERGFRWLAAAFALLYGVPAAGLLLAALQGIAIRDEVLQFGMFASAPCYVVALVHLRTNVVITEHERRIAMIDSLVALLAFLAIFAQIRDDEFAATERPWFIAAVILAQAIAAAGVIWLVSRNRFVPILPAKQLWLWAMWVMGFIVFDLIGAEHGGDYFDSAFVLSVIGTCVAGWCAIAAAVRASDEGETADQSRQRERWARAIPLLPPLLAVALFLYELAVGNTIGTFAIIVGFAAMLLLMVLLVALREITGREMEELAQAAAHRDLTESTDQQWFRSLVSESSDVVTLVDVRGNVGYQTPSVTRVLGHPPTAWMGHPFMEMVAAENRDALSAAFVNAGRDQSRPLTLEIGLLSRAGGYILTESTISCVVDSKGPVSGFVVTSRDITDTRRMRELLDVQADSDGLTGLSNLAALRRQINRALTQSEPDTVAVIAIDLNGFRKVNDSLGHALGDEVLSLVADGLVRCVRPWDVVARVGGDEFAILVVGNQIDRSAALIFERIQRLIAGLILSDGSVVPLSASAGYSVNDRGHEGAEELLRNADLALSRSRTSSHVELLRFEHHMHDALLRRVQVENELRHAFANNEFVMYFQPIVRLPSRRITGAEALLRWRHPERGMLSAYEFIEQIDDLGLGGELRALAVDRAVAALAAITKEHPYDDTFNLSFNVSADQLTPELLTDIGAALDQHGAPPSHLTVEVTESSIASVQEATTVLERIHALGLQIAIDDFGVGYSSLGYLAHFPVDYIKIDRSFVQGIDVKPNLERLTEAIVVLGEALNRPPVVEGVETEAELDAIVKAGARYAQGWLFDKALPLGELLAALDRQGEHGLDDSSAFAQQVRLDFAADS